ncbi:hypothetical protein [Sphingopyxis sp.]|uniref:hypothetical protein n=1 Tax=Sphingopyxis sp. TaxID=1908224 RepID=UPI00261A6C70|nr:hypothetical protein [Sphingopyxis sp.]MCW0196975.1 hypothetical protein [Sphingopyxis sp.]
MARSTIVKNRAGVAFGTVLVFSLLFFYVAPIIQLYEANGYLVNFFPVEVDGVVWANLVVFIFLSVFQIVYMRNMKKRPKSLFSATDGQVSMMLPVFIMLTVVMAFWGLYVVRDSRLLIGDIGEAGASGFLILRHKTLFMIPFFTAAFYMLLKKERRSLVVLGGLILCVMATKNIFLDRRNALGPLYISMVFFYFYWIRMSARNVFLIATPGLIIGFPILSIFINNKASSWSYMFTFSNVVKEISGHFNDIHYDAWANIVAMITFVREGGFQMGHQILGSILFFVPRDFWSDKPVSSGEMLGEYLLSYYNLWFTNISFSYPAEGYVDFGVLGIAVYSAILALYSKRLDWFAVNGTIVERISATYFAFYLFFVLRGPLLPAVAYGVGAYAALNVIPFLLSRLAMRQSDQQVPQHAVR